MEIEVNGVKYRLIKNPAKAQPPKNLVSILALAGAFALFDPRNQKTQTQEVYMSFGDLVKEYELIQRKESALSRRQRDAVVWRFNKMFERI